MWAPCCARAAAFGFDGVLLSDGCASVWAPKTLRASMGAAVRIPVIEAGKMPEAIAALRAKGITCLAAALYKSQPLSAAERPLPGRRLRRHRQRGPGPDGGDHRAPALARCASP